MKEIKTRLEKKDYEDLQQKATKANLSIYQYLRNCVKSSNIKNYKELQKLKLKKLYHLNKIGNNINQITKKINMVKNYDLDLFVELLKNLKDIKKMIKEV